MSGGLRICALVPVYNNAGTVADVVEGCLAHVQDVVVVDDGSTDGSASDLVGAPGVHVVRRGRNFGKGEALRRGFEKALALGYTHAVTLDADGQHDPGYIPRFIEAVEHRPGAIIVGVRDLDGARAPGISQFGRSFSNFWYAVETGRHIADAQSGYRAYPIERTLALRTRSMRYPMEHEVLVLASWSGMDVVSEVSMDVRYGDDIVSHFRRFSDNARFSGLNAGLSLARWSGAWRLARRKLPDPPTSDTRPPWLNERGVGNQAGYWWFSMLARTVGIDAAYDFLDVIVTWYAALAPEEYRRASMDYLTRMFPSDSILEMKRHQWRHFHAFGEAVLDQSLLPQVGLDHFDIGGEGLERTLEVAEQGRGLILLGAHVGPWQFGAMGMARLGVTVKIAALVQEARNIDAYMTSVRSRSPFPMPEILLLEKDTAFSSMAIANALQQGGVVALHADRHTMGRSVLVPFLGRPARFPLGPFVLSELTGAPIAIWFAHKVDRRTVRMKIHEPMGVPPGNRRSRDERLEQAAQRYVSLLEDHVRIHPYEWFNFYDYWGLHDETRTDT